MDPTLVLVVIASPEEPSVGARLACAAGGSSIGRSVTSTHCLAHPAVSRKHAHVARHAGGWSVVDHGSSAGTRVNGVAIAPETPAPITPGDELGIGPWRMRVEGDARQPPSTLATLSGDGAPATVFAPSRRLESLSACIASLAQTSGERALARAALAHAMDGIGASRGAVLKPPTRDGAGAPLVLALERAGGVLREMREGGLRVPRSLVTNACAGRTAVIDDGTRSTDIAVSIAEQSIHSAVCTPVTLDDRVVALVYVDARESEARIRDGASFVEDVAQVYSLALAYDARREIERRQASMRADIERARTLRDMLAPPERVDAGAYRVAHAMRAGAFVSGDLVGVLTRDDGRVGVLFGDASGHGVGAGMMTALAQSYLHSELEHDGGLGAAIERTNRFIATRETQGAFVSLWAALLSGDGSVTHVDAGHGHWMVVRADGSADGPVETAGPPLGVLEEARYPESSLELGVGDRIVLYTDGVSEREDGSGEQIGRSGVAAALAGSSSCEGDVEGVLAVLDALRSGAHDDATVMSVERIR
ncbi:MAG: SpoIIE family protein phosphatase [Planctomycetota bacterium]